MYENICSLAHLYTFHMPQGIKSLLHCLSLVDTRHTRKCLGLRGAVKGTFICFSSFGRPCDLLINLDSVKAGWIEILAVWK